jgi:hypothetical protein
MQSVITPQNLALTSRDNLQPAVGLLSGNKQGVRADIRRSRLSITLKANKTDANRAGALGNRHSSPLAPQRTGL